MFVLTYFGFRSFERASRDYTLYIIQCDVNLPVIRLIKNFKLWIFKWERIIEGNIYFKNEIIDIVAR